MIVEGTKVLVVKDDGSVMHTTARTGPFICASGQEVIFLDGISGYYLASRVTEIEDHGDHASTHPNAGGTHIQDRNLMNNETNNTTTNRSLS